MALSADTQSKIDKALQDKQSADAADVEHQAKLDALNQAIKDESLAKDASLEAHKVAANSAHDALVALAAELGVPLA